MIAIKISQLTDCLCCLSCNCNLRLCYMQVVFYDKMSDYISRSEIDRILDLDEGSSYCLENDNESEASEQEDGAIDIDTVENDARLFDIDDLFQPSSDDDDEIEGPKVKYIATSGKDVREYLAYPPPITRRAKGNILREKPGLKQSGKVTTIIESFEKFLTTDILSIIVTHTNEEATRKNVQPTNNDEILCFVGILILLGANNDNSLSILDLWSQQFGRPAYIAGMSRTRFQSLLSLIRFDDKQTRLQRREEDKFAPLREFFETVNDTLMQHFIPSENIVIDEMLSLFRGRCPFKVFMKEKPGKYGILIRILADCVHRTVLNMEVYSGKRTGIPHDTVSVVKRLINPISGSGRNVTTDRFYTSVVLAEDLYQNHNLTLVGTLQSNRKFIPKELKNTEGRPLYSSMFAFTESKSATAPVTLQSYIAKDKPKRNLLLLSTQHQDDTVDQDVNGKHKSDINLFYNSTKGGVDTIDQMARKYTVKRSTQRWPLTVFYTLIDIMCINAYSIYILNNPEWNKTKTGRRRIFLQTLGLDLIKPHVRKRCTNLHGLQNNILIAMEQVLGEKVQRPTASANKTSAKGRCHSCCEELSAEKRRKLSKIANICCKCQNYVCGKHSNKVYCCLSCDQQIDDAE